jgi:hypothetical protein
VSKVSVPGESGVFRGRQSGNSDLIVVDKIYKNEHKPGRLVAALRLRADCLEQIDELELLISEVYAEAEAVSPDLVRQGIPAQAEAGLARQSLGLRLGNLPVADAVIVDLESVRMIDRIAVDFTTFGDGQAVMSGSGLLEWSQYRGQGPVTFAGHGRDTGFSTTGAFAGDNAVELKLPLNGQMTKVAQVTF